MGELDLDENKTIWSLIKTMNVKEILTFLDNGTVSINACKIEPVKRCDCGHIAKYIKISISAKSMMRCDYDIKFFCEECYNEKVLGS